MDKFDYKIALAVAPGKSTCLFVPSYRGQELTVWSSTDEAAAREIFRTRTSLNSLEKDLQFKEVESQSLILDNLNLNPFLIKIDVEGGEADVLAGLSETIRWHYPVLMIENNDPEVIEILGQFCYQAYVYDAEAKKFRLYDNQANLNLIYISRRSGFYEGLLAFIDGGPGGT